MAMKKVCGGCRFPTNECACFSRSAGFRFLGAFLFAMMAAACSSPQEKAAQFGTRDLGLTGVSVEHLCQSGEMPFQVRGQKYSANIPVIDQRFQLGVAQVLCCSSDSCRVSGESTLFPRPSFVGAGDMIEQWRQKFPLPSVSWPGGDIPAPPRFDGPSGYRPSPNAVPIAVHR